LAFLSPIETLEEITAMAVEISAEDTKALAKSRKLKTVKIPFCTVSDKSLAHLADLPQFEHLDLEYTSITDKAGPSLARMKSVKYLNLNYTDVTDAIVPYLLKMPRLEALTIGDMSSEAREKLRKRGLSR
jgi:hypothetical protein